MVIKELNMSMKTTDRVQCFLSPKTDVNKMLFEKYYSEFTGNKKQKTIGLEVNEGRCIKIPAVGKVSRMSLDFVINSSLGAADFRAIFRHVRVLFLENVVQIDASIRNDTARFVMMVW